MQNFNMGFSNNKVDVLIHLTQWQYWWWFWFSFLWVLYYLLVARVFRYRTLKFNPRIASTLRPHGKWGDLLTCLIPVSWCINILLNSNFILKLIEWQSESSLFTLRVRAKQWYWIYKLDLRNISDVFSTPRNVGRNKWQFSTFGDLQTAEDYLHIMQMRAYKSWSKDFWIELNKKFPKKNRLNISTSVDVYRNEFLSNANMTYYNNTLDLNGFYIESSYLKEQKIFKSSTNLHNLIKKNSNKLLYITSSLKYSTGHTLFKNITFLDLKTSKINILDKLENKPLFFKKALNPIYSLIFDEMHRKSRRSYNISTTKLSVEDLTKTTKIKIPSKIFYPITVNKSISKKTPIFPLLGLKNTFMVQPSSVLESINNTLDLISTKTENGFRKKYVCTDPINLFRTFLKMQKISFKVREKNKTFFKGDLQYPASFEGNKRFLKFKLFKKNELSVYRNKEFKNEVLKQKTLGTRLWSVSKILGVHDFFQSEILGTERMNTIRHPDFDDENRILKRSSGKSLPFRVLKCPNIDTLFYNNPSNDIELLRFRFNSVNSKVANKPVKPTLYLTFKQKRYNQRTNIAKKTENFFDKESGNESVYSGNPFLKDLSIIEENYGNPTRQYRMLKKAKSRLDSTKVANWNRLLRSRRVLVLPAHVNITVITNSFDVVHSWHIPGLGLKMDCLPGRATHHTMYIDNVGLYYGQCAEICGRYHHHMPIRVCALPFEHFLVWWHTFGLPKFLFMPKREDVRFSVNKYFTRRFSW